MRVLLKLEDITYYSILNDVLNDAIGIFDVGAVLLILAISAAVAAWLIDRHSYRGKDTFPYIVISAITLATAAVCMMTYFGTLRAVKEQPDKVVIKRLLRQQ